MNAYGGILVVAIVCLSLTWFPLGTLADKLTFEVPYEIQKDEGKAASKLYVGNGSICHLGVTIGGLKCMTSDELSTSHSPPSIGIAIVQDSETTAKLVYFTGRSWPSKTVAAILGPKDNPKDLSFSKRLMSRSISIRGPAGPKQKFTLENGKKFVGPINESSVEQKEMTIFQKMDETAFTKLKKLKPPRRNDDQYRLVRRWVRRFPKESDQGYANRLVVSWKSAGIKVVAFGFDGTLIDSQLQEKGGYRGYYIHEIKLTDHAERLIQACWDNGVGVWIASNQESPLVRKLRKSTREMTYAPPPPSKKPVELHEQSLIAEKSVTTNCYWPTKFEKLDFQTDAEKSWSGAPLITQVLTSSSLKFGDHDPISIVTFSPDPSRPGSDAYTPTGQTELRPKIIHLQQVARIAKKKNSQVMLIDDELANIQSAVEYGFLGAHVSESKGIKLDSLRPLATGYKHY